MIARAMLLGGALCAPFASHASSGPLSQGSHHNVMQRPPWESCLYCHGPAAANTIPPIPVINGLSAIYIAKQLEDYRAGRRHDPSMMMSSALILLNRRDGPVVARHFSELPVPKMRPTAKDRFGALLYREGTPKVPACASCHGFQVPPPGYPRLFGQSSTYLARQMTRFRNGERNNDPGQLMRGIATALSAAQTEAITRYLSDH